MSFLPGLFPCPPPSDGGGGAEFPGGNQSHGSLKAWAESLDDYAAKTPTGYPSNTLTINGQSMGPYSVCIKRGDQTVSSFNSSDWFPAVDDDYAHIIVVAGNLTINSGQVFQPANRMRTVTLYVTGNLTISGELSMSARGANHDSYGYYIEPVNIRIATGTFGGVVNPQIPQWGGSGGPPRDLIHDYASGVPGGSGTAGGTGGGMSGGADLNTGHVVSGGGAGGTCYSGGPGGGAAVAQSGTAYAQAGVGYGSYGGAAESDELGERTAGGGAGNPGGAGADGGSAGGNGTGGALVVFCLGTFSGAGAVKAHGVQGGSALASGGGSGGGSITILYGTDNSSITPIAYNCGVSGYGTGSCRKLALSG